MLSVEPVASAEAAAQPPASPDEHSWLPDFDSPGITIALPPLTYSGSQSLDDCLIHPSLANPSAADSPEPAVRPQSLAENHVGNASPAVSAAAQSPAIASIDPALAFQPIVPCPETSPDDADVTAVTLLDRLGLNFDFHTDPAIEAISDSPLYLSFASHDIISAPRDDTPAADEVPVAQPLSPLPELPLDPASSSASPLSLESEASSNKSSTRRASIAGMLKKRLSKCSDANGDIAPTTISPSPSNAEANVVVLVAAASATDDIQPTQEVLPAEPELSHNSDDATCDIQTAPSPAEPVAEPPTAAPVAFVADVAIPEPAAHLDSQQKDEEPPAVAPPTGEAGEECDAQLDHSGDTQTQALSEAPPCPVADPAASAPTPETPMQQGDDVDLADAQLPPPPRRPSIHRHLDRRSSRILEGLTRKVQHVRQTTSMVLRRSVASHLSFRPTTPPDVFQGSVVGLAGLRGCGLNDGELEQERVRQPDDGLEKQAIPPPQYSPSDGEPTDTRALSTGGGGGGGGEEANLPANEEPSHENGHINEIGDKLVDMPATRSITGLNATSDKIHASNHMDTFSRKLSSVKHGTNVAVRNSVTRVKNIFAAKRSVAA